MKSRIRIHPMLILLSILGGLSLFGAMGIFFGPIALSVTMAMVDIYRKEFRKSVETIDEA
jgi:predicted PurR-regulated permease PerM